MGSVLTGIGGVIGSIPGAIAGGAADASGATSQYQAQLPPIQQQQFSPGIQQSQVGFNQNIDSQNELARALLAQSQGQGPNPAALQLQQTTAANIAGANGLIASQKGLNPALAARLAGQNAANANQTAAGQAAVLGAQQQLAAQNQLAGVYSNVGQQQLGMQNTLQSANASQNNAINQGSLGTSDINSGTSSKNAQTRGQIAGGIFQGIGSAAAMSAGGRVDGKAQVPGDSPKNDRVPVMLSPGEIVIPRSKAHDPEKSKAFIDHLMKSKTEEGGPKGYAKVLEAHRKLHSRVSALEKKIKKGA